MALFEWNAGYSVQVPSIDVQHKKLVGMVNDLHDARIAGKGNQVVGEILKGLIEYTKTHFAYEEKLMRDIGFPDLDSHKKLHSDLLNQVNEVWKKFEVGQKALSGEVFDFLKDWLINHIQGSDMKYAPYAKKKGAA